ncbi:MAG: PepSY-associated TM helix domain-containing protein [Sphingobacterium sp.]
MNLRNYNIYFNTHTISGIIACALLYVIFFAGSFSFFRDEIAAWQKNVSYKDQAATPESYDLLLDSLAGVTNLHGRQIAFFNTQEATRSFISVSESKDSVLHKQNLAKVDPQGNKTQGRRAGRGGDAQYFNYDFVDRSSGSYNQEYDMAEFLYRLHFLAQLNEVPIRLGIAPFGYLVAGVISFLFLFALITGLLLHWDKIVSNFFVFRPFNKWKTVWTDMHTALGVIGFPYQFMYAVTGLFLIINSVMIVPFSTLLYAGNSEALYGDLGQAFTKNSAYSYRPMEKDFRLSEYLHSAKEKWPDSEFKRVTIQNYGDSNMLLIMEMEPEFGTHFAGTGILALRVADGTVVAEKSPTADTGYLDWVHGLIYRLHFGDFGGYPLKIVYFILGVMGCLVMISGILIWLVARDKPKTPVHKRKFNFWAANVFTAGCLTMLPVTALTFIAVKFNPTGGQSYIYQVYFYSWLILGLYYLIRRSIARTNRETLLSGALLSFLVPIAQGVVTGNWMWYSLTSGQIDIFIVDLLWLIIALVAFLAYRKSTAFFKKLAT